MSTGWIIFIIVTVLLIGGLVALTILGKKMQKKQEESETTMRQGAQIMSIFVIDKARKKLVESGLPQIVSKSQGRPEGYDADVRREGLQSDPREEGS